MRIIIFTALLLLACSGGNGSQDTGTGTDTGTGDTDTDTDSDSGTDSSTDSDTDSDTETEDAGPSCTLEYEPEMPLSNCEVEWAYVYENLPGVTSGRAEAIVELSNGGFAVFGDSGTLKPIDSGDTTDGMMMMLDENGNMTDFRSYPAEGMGGFERAHSTSLGNLAIGGQYADLWAVMFNDDGSEVFNQGYPDTTGISDSYYDGVDTVVTTSARYLGLLNIEGTSHQKAYTTEYPLNSYGIAPAGNSATAVVGWIWMDVPPDHFDNDYWESFFMLWDPTMNEPEHRVVCPGFDARLLRIVPAHGGGFLAGGWVETAEDHGARTYVVKLDDDGVVEWTRYYGLNNSSGVSRILRLDDGYIYAAVWNEGSSYQGYISKVNNQGQIQWHFIPFDQPTVFTDIIELSDSGYIAVGHTYPNNRPIAVKIRSAGECI